MRLLKSLLSSYRRGGARAPDAHLDNPLAKYFFANDGRMIDKWHHYFEIYHRHFERFRARSPVVMEIGVFHGGSLGMWKSYFGPGARIVGVDIDPRTRQFADDTTTIFIGDQADRRFLAELRERVPHVDILIDDGGHHMAQQIATFEELYGHVAPDGIYLCEDMHTSLVKYIGAGVGQPGTFLEYSKALVDRLYAWYSEEPELLSVDPFTLSTFALHFYDSVLVIEKRPMQRPVSSRRGTPSF